MLSALCSTTTEVFNYKDNTRECTRSSYHRPYHPPRFRPPPPPLLLEPPFLLPSLQFTATSWQTQGPNRLCWPSLKPRLYYSRHHSNDSSSQVNQVDVCVHVCSSSNNNQPPKQPHHNWMTYSFQAPNNKHQALTTMAHAPPKISNFGLFARKSHNAGYLLGRQTNQIRFLGPRVTLHI